MKRPPALLARPPVALVAVDAARGVHRRWQVAVTRDLFGYWLVERAWGRIGAGGRTRIDSFADAGAAHAHAHRLLARRAGARRRIGVAYLLVDMSTSRVVDM